MEQPGAADRRQVLLEQQLGVEPGKRTIAIADFDVEARCQEIVRVVRGRDAHLDFGMLRLKHRHARKQPARGKGGQYRDLQEMLLRLAGCFHPGGKDTLQRLAHLRDIGFAFRRQRHGIAAAPEDLEPQLVLEALDPLADRRGGDELLFAGAREIAVPRRALDDLQ